MLCERIVTCRDIISAPPNLYANVSHYNHTLNGKATIKRVKELPKGVLIEMDCVALANANFHV